MHAFGCLNTVTLSVWESAYLVVQEGWYVCVNSARTDARVYLLVHYIRNY